MLTFLTSFNDEMKWWSSVKDGECTNLVQDAVLRVTNLMQIEKNILNSHSLMYAVSNFNTIKEQFQKLYEDRKMLSCFKEDHNA